MPAVNYLWDPREDNIVEEFDDSGATIADYTTEPDHFGNVISQHSSGESSFFHYDGQGSTLAVTDDDQQVTDTRAYSAFGKTTETAGSTVFAFQYIGQKGYYRNSLTGQYLVRRRPYESALGRWMSPVPVESMADVTRPSSHYSVPLCRGAYIYACNNAASDDNASGLLPEPNASLFPFAPEIKIMHASVSGCIGAIMAVKFTVPPIDLAASGWVVQEVHVGTRVHDCEGRDVSADFRSGPDLHFWEAFEISSIRFRQNVSDPDDTFLWSRPATGTRGTIRVRGIVKGAGNVDLPAGFSPHQIPEAGDRPTTTTKPAGWDSLLGTQHNMTLIWDCCCPPHCSLMYTEPQWAIDIPPAPGSSCPQQIPSYGE